MNRKWTHSTVLTATLLMAAPAALAQQQPGDRPQIRPAQPGLQQGQHDKTDQMLSQLDLARVTKLIDKQVTDQQGQPCGTVKDIIIDPEHGFATFAVISLQAKPGGGQEQQGQQPGQIGQERNGQQQAGQLGNQQQKMVLVPFETLSISDRQPDKITLNVDRQKLDQRPAFQEAQIQQLKQREFVEQQCQAFNVKPYWDKAEDGQGVLDRLQEALPGEDKDQLHVQQVSKLKSKSIVDDNDQQLGQFKDMLVDTEEGRLAYLVVGLQGGQNGQQAQPGQQPNAQQRPQAGQQEQAGQNGQRIGQQIGGQMALVPWAAVDYKEDRQQLSIDTDRQTLQRQAFAEGQWPNLNDEQVARNLHQQFGEEPYWEVYGYPRYEEGQQQQRNGQQPRPGQTERQQPREPIGPFE